jgi:hypothetical protein
MPRSRLMVPFFLLWFSACRTQPAPVERDASVEHALVVHVPGALRVARAIDSLTVEVDPVSCADTVMKVDPGMTIGMETELRAFVIGGSGAVVGSRSGRISGGDCDVGASTWNTAQDAIPQSDKKYFVEMNVVLFETDVPPAHHWDPHAGHFKALLTRSLRQAEE